VFEFIHPDEFSYKGVINAIRHKEKDESKSRLVKTYEYYPEEGKYHIDGHRKCNISLTPEESKRYNNICPVCRRPLTLGVLHRIDDLSDRPIGFRPDNAIPYEHLVPLREIISKVLKKGILSKAVHDEYFRLIKYFGSEFKVLHASKEDLALEGEKNIAEAILMAQEERLTIIPGYDGVFGKVEFSNKTEQKKKKPAQGTIWDF